MLVDIFIPCFIDQFYPKTGVNFAAVMERAGAQVRFHKKQGCCGQPPFNAGYWKDSMKLAQAFMDVFADAEYIVSPSGSCTGFVKNYYQTLFKGTPYEEKSREIGAKLYEMTDFLVNVLKCEDLGAHFNGRVAYHDSCSALREYGIKEQPRRLLAKVRGLELVEMDKAEECCGFGGTFSAKFPDLAAAMAEQKAQSAIKAGVEYIITTESSCLMNLEGYIQRQSLPLKVLHIADVLAHQ